MSAAHTPEPWAYSPDRDTHAFCIHREGTVLPRECDSPCTPGGVVGSSEWIWLSEADALRIIACVNACEGVPNEALDRGSVAELAWAADRTIKAFESLGRASGVIENARARHECEAAMVALKTAIASAGGN